MSDIRYSVMILPRRSDGKILLQTWTEEGITTTDGFGSFYLIHEDPKQVARNEITRRFNIKVVLTEAASLQYFIDKPTGLVDLKVIVYFADITDDKILEERMHWFASSDIPYSQMHEATRKWLPIILENHTQLKATIMVAQPGDHTSGKVTEFTVN